MSIQSELTGPDVSELAEAEHQSRRRESRDDVCMPLEVSRSHGDGSSEDPESRSEWHRAWTCNVSGSGICFRSSTPIPPGRILVREGGAANGNWLGIEIVRCRKVSRHLWEYGGLKCSADADMTFEIPQGEFSELRSRLSTSAESLEDPGAEEENESRASASRDCNDRHMILSLRRVANWSSKLQRLENRRRHYRRVKSLVMLFVLSAAVLFLIQLALGGGVSVASWGVLTTLTLLTMAFDWRISWRLREMQRSLPRGA